MNRMTTSSGSREFTGWHMLAVLGLFFGTIVSVNMWLAYQAGATWTGLVVKNTYVESQNFDRRRVALKAQMAAGWQTKFRYQDGLIVVDVSNSKARLPGGLSVVAMIGRPVQEGEDHVLHLDQIGIGQYAQSAALGTGLWEAFVTVRDSQGAELSSQEFRFHVER
jgi:nitrogen fixation protein FixH